MHKSYEIREAGPAEEVDIKGFGCRAFFLFFGQKRRLTRFIILTLGFLWFAYFDVSHLKRSVFLNSD